MWQLCELLYTCYLLTYLLTLAPVKSRLVLPLWYRLTWVVPDKGPLNGCVCGSFINHGGLALVEHAGVQLSRLRLPFSPSSFEFDCVRVSSGGASYVLLTLYRPGSDHVSSVFFDELGRILESIVALSTPIVLAGDQRAPNISASLRHVGTSPVEKFRY